MTRKIPEDAFEAYVAQGTKRSYQVLADQFGVSKRAITKCAAREDWKGRLAKIEQNARERSDAKLTDSFEQMRERHMTTLNAMHRRALAALAQFPLSNGMEAMRAAEMAIKLERLVAGEATDRSALSVEQIIKTQQASWLEVVDDGDDQDPD